MSTLGAMRHRLKLQREVKTADGGGGHGRAWSTVATVWGSLTPLSGNESPRAQRLENPITHKITIRHRAGLTGADRILLGTRVFNIVSILDPDERGRFLEIRTIEGAAV